MLESIHKNKYSTVCITHRLHNIYISDYLRMEVFLYKKTENCEKNYKQTCSEQKNANVSSVNERVSQNRYQLNRGAFCLRMCSTKRLL